MKHYEDGRETPGFLLWQVSKLWQRHLAIALKELNLSNTQFVILGNIVRLAREQRMVTQIMVSAATKVDPMSTSHVISVLEKKKLVTRIDHPEDKRAYYVQPTEEGINLSEQALKKVIETHEIFFQPLEENTEMLVTLLMKLIDKNDIPYTTVNKRKAIAIKETQAK
ncbi:MAG TPA: MarR family transcriptional regulator [Anaerolineae bacterium]|nr:MarR family transcriptional regulator [Anaerolineae bacterium]